MSESTPPQKAPAASPDDAAIADARAVVVRTLQRAVERHEFEDPAIRHAVEDYSRLIRAAGRPPEWLVIDLKRLVLDDALPTVREWFRGVVSDRAVAWGIQGYYGMRTPERG